ncbi:HD domain-containing protein [candidate division WOR-3 bacterium]|nr:HD domain-containing protein [candidate division WOR-3 bacterium]
MEAAIARSLDRLGRVRGRLVELAGDGLYVVGGTVRDALLDREPTDFDFAVPGSGVDFAGRFARETGGAFVPLSEPDDEARVVLAGRTFDFVGLGAGTIDDDLRRRDFTINALGCLVTATGVGDLLDPTGGRQDLAARVIRPASDGALASDPLRLLRAARFALELGMVVDDAVFEQGRKVSLRRVAGERVGAELLRVLEQPGGAGWLDRLDRLGRLAELLPGFEPVLEDPKLRGHSFRTMHKVEEICHGETFFSRFGPEYEQYFDRWGADEQVANDECRVTNETRPETREVTTDAVRNPGWPFRRALLKLAGLLHDFAKPETRFETVGGEVHFYGHDSLGARAAARVCHQRLRLARHQVKMVRTLVQEHMRLHLLATGPELSDRAVRRFFRDLGEEAFGMMIICYADGWATAGKTYHLEDAITRMIGQKRAEDAQSRVERLVTGHDLIALGLRPGPAFKVILRELEDLQIEGKITSREQGLEYVKTNLPGLSGSANGE